MICIPQKAFAAISILLALVTAGCTSAGFQHPLVEPEKAELPLELLGNYRSVKTKENKDVVFIEIGRAGKDHPAGFLRVSDVKNERDEVVAESAMVVFMAKIKDSYIVHIPNGRVQSDQNDWTFEKESEIDAFNLDWDPDLVEAYTLVALRKTESGFDLFELNLDFIEEQIKANKLDGRIRVRAKPVRRRGRHRKQKDLPPKPRKIETPVPFDDFDLLVREKPAELHAYFNDNLEKLLGERLIQFVRVK